MGYDINQRCSSFNIKNKTNVKKAWKAVKELAQTGNHFSWVNTKTVLEAKTFKDAMCEFRWEVEMNDNGGVCTIYFGGDKAGDQDQVLSAIAPFVEAGSYIEMQGENGEIWRYCFNGSRMTEVQAEIHWPE